MEGSSRLSLQVAVRKPYKEMLQLVTADCILWLETIYQLVTCPQAHCVLKELICCSIIIFYEQILACTPKLINS